MATTRLQADLRPHTDQSTALFQELLIAFRGAVSSYDQAAIDVCMNNNATWEAVRNQSAEEKIRLIKFSYHTLAKEDFKKFLNLANDVSTVREFKRMILMMVKEGRKPKNSHVRIIDRYLKKVDSSMFSLFSKDPSMAADADISLKRKLPSDGIPSKPVSKTAPDLRPDTDQSTALFQELLLAFRGVVRSREQAAINVYMNHNATWEAVRSQSAEEKIRLIKFSYHTMTVEDFKKFVNLSNDVSTVSEFKRIILMMVKEGHKPKNSHVRIIDRYLKKADPSMFSLFSKEPSIATAGDVSLKRKLPFDGISSEPAPKAARLGPSVSVTESLFSAAAFFEGASEPSAPVFSPQTTVSATPDFDWDSQDYGDFFNFKMEVEFSEASYDI